MVGWLLVDLVVVELCGGFGDGKIWVGDLEDSVMVDW